MLSRVVLLVATVGVMYSRPGMSQDMIVDVAAVKTLVTRWNDAHDINRVETLSSLYATRVDFYGTTILREKCLSIKRTILKNREGENHSLKRDLALSAYSSGVIRCDFTKSVTVNNEIVDFEMYLLVREIGGTYRIVGESDVITDRKLKNEPAFGS